MSEHDMTTITPQRHVRFSDTNETRKFQRAESEYNELWWPNDFGSRSKANCISLGRTWQKQGYDALLNDAFENPAEDTQSKLNTFVILGDACVPRGLERYISAKHAEERRIAKVQSIECVVDLCTYMRRNNKSFEEIETELYNLSTEHTWSSRKFAHKIALADEHAVMEEALIEEAEGMAIATKTSKKGISYGSFKKNSKLFTKMMLTKRSSHK